MEGHLMFTYLENSNTVKTSTLSKVICGFKILVFIKISMGIFIKIENNPKIHLEPWKNPNGQSNFEQVQ